MILLSISFFQRVKNSYYDENACKKEIERELKGVIDSAFFDENQEHKGFVIIFKNGDIYRPPFFLKKLEAIPLSKNDSLFKEKGTLKILFYKRTHQGYLDPIVLDDSVACDRL